MLAPGNMAIGNTHHFLPAIINLVQSNNEKRLLALHALKEVANTMKLPILFPTAKSIA
jgi:cullin-associated NEDD8-dissociated protein 1